MRTYIAIPCMDMVHTAFMQSLLALRPVGDTHFGISASSLVYDSRNTLAKRSIDEGYDRVLWLDSDMVFEPDLLERLSAVLDTGVEFCSGIYFTRKNPVRPCIFSEYGYNRDGREVIPFAKHYEDYPKDARFEIQACGFGGVLMTTKLIQKVFNEFGAPFAPQPGFGEDLSFCIRAHTLGTVLYCDSTVKLGHIAQHTIAEGDFLEGVKL